MQRLPRPILIFYFRWLRAFGCIVALWVTIVTNDLAKFFLRLRPLIAIWIASRGICSIYRNDRGGVLKLLPAIPLIIFFLFFLSLFRGLSAVEALKSWGLRFLRPKLRFLNSYVLHWLALGTGFGCWRPTILKAVLIGFACIRAGLESGLGLGVDGFLISSLKPSSFQLHCSVSNLIEVRRLFRKYQIIVAFSRAHSGLNWTRIDCWYFRWAT